jgi:ankyrin repeat protein
LASTVQKGDVASIDRLVAKGVDVNAKGRMGMMTPLFWAIQTGSKVGFRRLLDLRANPDQTAIGDLAAAGVASWSVMILAIESDDRDWLEMLLRHGANPNLVAGHHVDFGNSAGFTPIFYAITQADRKKIEMLLAHGALLDHQDESGNTPVMYAAGRGYYEIVAQLLRAGANCRVRNNAGETLEGLLRTRLEEAVEVGPKSREVAELRNVLDLVTRKIQTDRG